jgi:pyrrolidone-carboxylate peptidase
MMKLLVYGFEPYGKYRKNISQEVIQQLKKREGQISTYIFPVRFDQQQFRQVIEQLKPDAILGLGQYSKGSKIRIEQKGRNLMGSKQDIKRKIDSTGPDVINTSLPLPQDQHLEVSDNAGIFVCNFSIYVVGRMAEAMGIPFGFLHLPKDFSKDQAVAIVEGVVDRILSA